MSPVKTAVRKTSKTTARTAKKVEKTVTPDDVWKIIAEIAKVQKETQQAQREAQQAQREAQKEAQKEAEKAKKEAQKAKKEAQKEAQQAQKEIQKAIKETQEMAKKAWFAHQETEKAIKETQKAHQETEKAIKETQRHVSGLGNTLGLLVERIMTPDLPRQFKEFGFTFSKISTIKWTTDKGNPFVEIDGLLENGDVAMAVEVKTKLEIKDIHDHIKRMKKIRVYADEQGDKRKFLGAMAATIITERTKNYALSQGLYLIEPSGENVKVLPPVDKAKIW